MYKIDGTIGKVWDIRNTYAKHEYQISYNKKVIANV